MNKPKEIEKDTLDDWDKKLAQEALQRIESEEYDDQSWDDFWADIYSESTG